MEHKKSILEPFRELGEILHYRWGEASLWFLQIVANPSPVHIAAATWNVFAGGLLYFGMQKVLLHYNNYNSRKR